MHQRCSHRFAREDTITASKHSNDEERIFAMLLILVLAPVFCPRLAEEEFRGVKQKNMLIRVGHTLFSKSTIQFKLKILMIKERVRPFHFDKRPTPKFHSFSFALGPQSRSSFSYPQRERSFPFWTVVGEEGFEPPTPWFVATCSNPLSYRPHPVSTGSVPGSTLKKGTFPLPSRFGLRRCESLYIRTVRSEV